jgi:hypothetical protein
MIRQTLLVATLALCATAAPAFARDVPAPAPAPADGQAAPVAASPRYCIIETPTGSHIPQKTCKTRVQWMQIGFDPLARPR